MNKTSTHCIPSSSQSGIASTQQQAKHGPSAKSIAFLRQFARCYHAEKNLSPALAGMILN